MRLPEISTILLNVTDRCNLRCGYCFEQGRDGDRPSMSETTARRSVDFLFDQLKRRKSAHIVFFGGEPMINWTVIVDTVDYAKRMAAKRRKTVTFGITTNGTLFTKEKVQFFRDNAFSIMVSVDSHKKEVNDRLRPAGDGKGSFDRVVKGLGLFDARDSVILRLSLTHLNTDILDYMEYFITSFDCVKDIVFGPVFSRSEEFKIQPSDMRYIEEQLELYIEAGCEHWKKGSEAPVYFLGKYVDRLQKADKSRHSCEGGRTVVSVSTTGNIYSCDLVQGEERFLIGDVHKGLNNKRRRELLSEIDGGRIGSCDECEFALACGGGCYAEAYLSKKTLDYRDCASCDLTRMLYRLADDLIRKLGNLEQ